MSFKRSQPGIRFSGERISPDEMDNNFVYQINNPATTALGTLWVGSGGTAGTASAIALIINNKYPDFPRNVAFNIHGTGVGMAGSLIINGDDQFGSQITETIGFTTANNGGTAVGTKVFAQYRSGTVYYGTAVGNGTPNIGLDGGTSCLFGLPVKIGATTDVISYSMGIGSGPISVGGGTAIGSLVNTGVHAVRPFAAPAASTYINLWVRPTFSSEYNVAGGTQAS